MATGGEEAAEKKRLEREKRSAIDVNDLWNQIEEKKRKNVEPVKDDQPGWKTVRIFVSSTFKDFHQEREVLVKEVFAELRAWCERKHLHLIDCDLRWGVPKETTNEKTVRTCLEEIDRCYQYNNLPFFVNMTCKRIGWIPLEEDLPECLWNSYHLVYGLSVTEMEIVHGAYHVDNPNALFLIRDESFLKQVEEKVKERFVDEEPIADKKLETLKQKIETRFPNNVITYNCKYVPGQRLYDLKKAGSDSEKAQSGGIPKLNLDKEFANQVLEFFKKRIEEQYPQKTEDEKVDEFVQMTNHHSNFMGSRFVTHESVGLGDRQDVLVGREEVLNEIEDYVLNDQSGKPKLIIGDAGAGKSSIMAKAAADALKYVKQGKVFFHFVGAVPKSTSIVWILKRLLKELDPEADFPDKLQDLAALVCNKLEFSTTHFVIFIDALNQIDAETQIETMFWLPEKLSSNVRCILSLIDGSEPHLALRGRKSFQSEMEKLVPDLEDTHQRTIMNNYLLPFNKKLDAKQMGLIMSNASSKNPLWLRIACEELRIYGDFRTVDEFIKNLKDGLPELLQQVLERFADETDRVLLIATLCLLEVSKFGLLEAELLEILADKENLEAKTSLLASAENAVNLQLNSSNTVAYWMNCMRSVCNSRLCCNRNQCNFSASGESPEEEEKSGAKKEILVYAEWASVYRNLRIFLRPYGNPSEGRLDFYHRTLSKVVRKMYLSQDGNSSEIDNKKCFWWHKKLVDFFRNSGTAERKVEEYPHHLLFLTKHAADEEQRSLYRGWLQDFLVNMEAFERLYDDEHSSDLLFYWRESGDVEYNQLCKKYMECSKKIKNDPTRVEQFSRVMGQAGKYEESLKLADDCLKMLKKSSDKLEKDVYDEKMIRLYSHIAHIKSITADTISLYEDVIDLHAKAIEIIENSEKRDEKKYKIYLALQLNKTAYAYAELCRLSGLYTGGENFRIGVEKVERSIALYREEADYAHELEAHITKAILYRETMKEQLKIYESTEERCRQIFGEEHTIMCRLCYNMGIVYDEADDFENAYKYFRKAYDTGLKVYGSKHSITEMYRGVLREETFAAIGLRLGHTVD